MYLVNYLHTAVMLRVAELRSAAQKDRGDSPVPTAVIIVGLAVIATVVTGLALAAADNWMNAIPTESRRRRPPAGPE